MKLHQTKSKIMKIQYTITLPIEEIWHKPDVYWKLPLQRGVQVKLIKNRLVHSFFINALLTHYHSNNIIEVINCSSMI